MNRFLAYAAAALAAVPLLAPFPIHAQPVAAAASSEERDWLYRGSDVPQDPAWQFEELENGLRYAVRRNDVPPGQVSIRIRIDAGSLHETDAERGFAHLLEHLTFRESKYLGPGEAIPTWQRLGATFGSDTNAETSPTHTVYKLDLPNAGDEALAESIRLLSGMIRDPVLNQANLDAEMPIVLAEKRERAGAPVRAADATRETLFAGQRLATRSPIGTEVTLNEAAPDTIGAFHSRWYRPENTVISVVGSAEPERTAELIRQWFGDWQPSGRPGVAPDFGDPDGANADGVGAVRVVVEPDLPRSFVYAVMRPWRPVEDTIAYNQGLLRDAVAIALINRRLEARARAGGSFLFAQVDQEDVSRSADATFVSFAPLGEDWRAALGEVRAVIADALASPPTREELDRELSEFDAAFVSGVEQKRVLPSAQLADAIVEAVDIRETVASPQTVLEVFRGMKDRVTPDDILAHSRALFDGAVTRAVYVTKEADADAGTLRSALAAPVTADGSARLAASTISFADLPPIGEPGEVVERQEIGVFDVEEITFDNGVKALLWPNEAEAGRVNVKVRFGAGYRGFSEADAPYIALGEQALVAAGVGELGQEELDRVATGRRLGFDFSVEDGVLSFAAQTRGADLADQLYLFAAKLAMPRWDAAPIERAIAASKLSHDSLATSPAGVLNRDLEYLLADRDPRFGTPDPAMLDQADAAGFERAWAPQLRSGPIEVLVFGDFEQDAAIAALQRTFGALPERAPIGPEALANLADFPEGGGEVVVRHHRGDANQAAAVIAWPTGGGVENLRWSRQLEILVQLFNNRLLDALREQAGASYSPNVASRWPVDVEQGGRVVALAQVRPEDVPVFFAEAQRIADDLAADPPSEDELRRVLEPLTQLIRRVSSGNLFWMMQMEGATQDPRRYALLGSLLPDYSQTTPEIMQALARRFLAQDAAFRLAVMPEGQELSAE
jgi:zinc protease